MTLWAALLKASADGIPITRLMDLTGMSRSWVYYRLQEHADAGRANQAARGRWRAHDPQNPPS